MTLEEALQWTVRLCPDGWAKAYAAKALEFLDTPDECHIKDQIPYILSNTTHWRGDFAKKVKIRLREELVP
jgi:hypothetical protein